MKGIIQTPLTEIRFAGAPVAAVAATTPELAQDAARAIVVEYEVLPHVVTADLAIKPNAPRVLPEPQPAPATPSGSPAPGNGGEANLTQKAKQGDLQKSKPLWQPVTRLLRANIAPPAAPLLFGNARHGRRFLRR